MAKGRKRKTGKREPNGRPMAMGDFAPTPEQAATGAFVATWQVADGHRAKAYRRTPVIDTLMEQGKLTARQYLALCRYRDVALIDDHSPIEDSIGKMLDNKIGVGGNGGGPSPFVLRNAIELGFLERELGALRDIARAVAVDDITLSQWAIQQGGSVMRARETASKVIRWFEPRRKFAEIALLEIRMAGERLAAAIRA